MRVLPAAYTQESRSVSERFIYLGYANLESGARLFEGIVGDPMYAEDWNRCCAAASLAEHGVELFLKGAIWQGAGDPGNTHELDQLFARFANLSPGNKFKFESRFRDLVSKVDDEPYTEYFRYPINTKRHLLHMAKYFDPPLWRDQMVAILEDLHRIEPAIYERHPYVALENVLWESVDTGAQQRTYRLGSEPIVVPVIEVVPEPRTGILRVGERGTLAITMWRARTSGLTDRDWAVL
jgi:hypothetical protein